MINPMKKLLLAARTSDRQTVLELLRESEIVHVDPVTPEKVVVPATLNESIENTRKVVALLQQLNPDLKGKLATPGTPSRLVEEALTHEKAIPEQRDKILALRQELEETAAWGNLGLKDIVWLEENGLTIDFYRGPGADSAEIAAEFVVEITQVGGTSLFMTASRQPVRVSEKFARVARPSREIEAITAEINICQKIISEQEHALACIAMRLSDVEHYYTKLLNRRRFTEVETGVHGEEGLFVLSGWCPANKASELTTAFEEAGIAAALKLSEPAEDEVPPTSLKKSFLSNSVQPLYDFMGLVPSYNEPETSGLFLSMLTVFAAFMVADAGYGLLVLVALLVAYKPLLNRGADRNFLHLGLFLFGGTTIYGLLNNSWFGETWHLFPGYRFDPGTPEGMITLQGLCFLMGVCHLTLAHIMKARRRKLDLTLLSEVGWIIFLWAMYGVVCMLILQEPFVLPFEFVAPMLKISLLLILLFTEPSLNPLKCIPAGIGAILLNAANCFSDIVSYIRLWAVGLAGGKVAGAFNEIAALLPMAVLRVPVYIAGHGVNMILGIIAILAHGVRLNLLEFSNHLELDWSGRKYDPFKEIK
ncbi:MAG: hypothetical protein A2W80_01700 [Candidatus Riflebacteria bacterium GWC2_50_8]|nr:MAG: hypothetical protein A2W80_01700 [Candidatus Riflebacteria bacterium GWC2_50_8]